MAELTMIDEKIIAFLTLYRLREKGFTPGSRMNLIVGRSIGLKGNDNAVRLKMGRYLKKIKLIISESDKRVAAVMERE